MTLSYSDLYIKEIDFTRKIILLKQNILIHVAFFYDAKTLTCFLLARKKSNFRDFPLFPSPRLKFRDLSGQIFI